MFGYTYDEDWASIFARCLDYPQFVTPERTAPWG